MSQTPPPPAPRRQPSLIDEPNDEKTHARKARSLRMLDGLDDEGPAATSNKAGGRSGHSEYSLSQAMRGDGTENDDDATRTSNGRAGWILAAAAALLVLGALWWWKQGQDAGQDAVAAGASTAANTAANTASNPGPTAGMTADANAPVQSAHETARIETVRDAEAHPSTSASAPGLQEGGLVAVGTPPSAVWAGPLASVGAAPGRAAAAAAATASSAPLHTAGAGPAAVPVRLGPSAAPSPATNVAATAPLAPVAGTTGAASLTGADPDVTLFNALLLRMAGGNARNDANAQRTLANMIERCESQAGADVAAAADCRPRFCAEKWGKADPCPIAMAPKSDR